MLQVLIVIAVVILAIYFFLKYFHWFLAMIGFVVVLGWLAHCGAHQKAHNSGDSPSAPSGLAGSR